MNTHRQNLYTKIMLTLFVGVVALSGHMVFADSVEPNTVSPAQPNVVSPQNPTSNTTAASPLPTLKNPIKFDSISGLLNGALDAFMTIAGIVAVLMIIWAGFKMVTARGDETAVTEARNMLYWTCVGIAVLFGARVILSIIETTINTIKS